MYNKLTIKQETKGKEGKWGENFNIYLSTFSYCTKFQAILNISSGYPDFIEKTSNCMLLFR